MTKHNFQNRRSFLKQSSLLALAPTVPNFIANYARANMAAKDERVLVVIQMDGGNDGVNTVVPFADEGYAKHRKELLIPTSRLLKLDDSVGLNPSMRSAATLWEDEQLAILPSVGYPNPNRSHDASRAIWQTCQFEEQDRQTHGWLGLSLDGLQRDSKGAPCSLMVGDRERPIALQGRKIGLLIDSKFERLHAAQRIKRIDCDSTKDWQRRRRFGSGFFFNAKPNGCLFDGRFGQRNFW